MLEQDDEMKVKVQNLSNQERLLYSIAISLKRIADVITKPKFTLEEYRNMTSEEKSKLGIK